jgi:hypothetical protein
LDSMRRPFIYISGMMRTGSTLVAEILTELPYSFIFREPGFARNAFKPRAGDSEILREVGVELHRVKTWVNLLAFLQRRLRWLGVPQDYAINFLKNWLLPRFDVGAQIGVKEIRNRGWRRYLKHFPGMKTIILGRDPRDIYISAFYRHAQGNLSRYSRFAPDTVAADLSTEFALQKALMSHTDSLVVKYETLCTEPGTIGEIRRFANSPLTGAPRLGQFLRRTPSRLNEVQAHQGNLTSRRVERWMEEDNRQLVAQAQAAFQRMRNYTSFWGYRE